MSGQLKHNETFKTLQKGISIVTIKMPDAGYRMELNAFQTYEDLPIE